MPVSTDSPDAGFSVLEAIIALTIVAMTLSAFYSGLRVALSALEGAREVASVENAARDLFAGLGVLYPLDEGRQTLRLGGGRVVVLEIKRLATNDSDPKAPRLSLYEVEVTITSGRGALPIRIQSARLAVAKPSP